MPAQQHGKRPADPESQGRQQRDAAIGKQVLSVLGEPDDWHRVQVREVWGDHYRVNVFVGGDIATTRIAHSYFLVADGNGNILASTPTIARQY
jgi:hypothetical protein